MKTELKFLWLPIVLLTVVVLSGAEIPYLTGRVTAEGKPVLRVTFACMQAVDEEQST